jgi:VanZ family protein
LSASRIFSLWAPVCAFMALIHFLSSQSSLPGSGIVWDKLAHAAVYSAFGVLCLRAFHGGIARLRLAPSVLAMLLTLGYAALDELHQSRVTGRYADVYDWIADTVGAGSACLVVVLVDGARAAIRSRGARRRRRPRNHPRR